MIEFVEIMFRNIWYLHNFLKVNLLFILIGNNLITEIAGYIKCFNFGKIDGLLVNLHYSFKHFSRLWHQKNLKSYL